MSDAAADDTRPDDGGPPALPGTHGPWRLALGPCRGAIYAAAAILGVGVAGVVLRAMAEATRGVEYLGPLLYGMANFVGATLTQVVVAGLATAAAFGRAQLAFDPKYLAWLRTTPWRPDRVSPPYGRPTLAGALGLLPAASLSLLAALRLPAAAPMACGAAVGVVLAAAGAALITLYLWPTLAIVALLSLLAPGLALDHPEAVAGTLVALLAVAEGTHRAATRKAWLGGRTVDVRQLNLQRRSRLGWLEQLPVRERPRRRGLELGAAATAAVIFASIGVATGSTDGRAFGAFQTGFAVLAGIVATFAPLTSAALSCDPLARLSAGRWLMPRMDRLLVTPAVMAAWAFVVSIAPWPHRSAWSPIWAAGCGFATIAFACSLPPGRLRWQTTGAARIAVAASKTQKQLEANLRRLGGESI